MEKRTGEDLEATPSENSPARAGDPQGVQQVGENKARLAQPALKAPDEHATIPPQAPSSPATCSMAAPGPGVERERYAFLGPPLVSGDLGCLGPYRVVEVLGAGGMGTVFLGMDSNLQRRVAIKAMKPSLAGNPANRQRFLREAQAAAAVKHDHVVTIYHVGEERGVPFLAMECLEGESLETQLQREGKLSVAEAVRIGREVAQGLAAAHKAGLVHRDIKPANLWLESGNRSLVKILDFGLARGFEGGSQLTQTGCILGTPAYMAPEQARAAHLVDHRCDLFSLGCVLYRMTTGRMPFTGDDPMTVLAAVNFETPVAPHALNPAVPVALSNVVMRLLSKEPSGRPSSAEELVGVLASLEAGETLVFPRPPWSGRRRAVTGLAASAVLASVVLVSVHLFGPERIEAPGPVIPDGPAASKALPKQAPDEPAKLSASPWDSLRRDQIAPEELTAAGLDNHDLAPAELVGILGDSRMMHWDQVRLLAFSADGKTVISGGDSTVRLWDVETGRARKTLAVPGAILHATLSADGKTLAAAYAGPKEGPGIAVFDVTTAKEIGSLPHANRMVLSPDGKELITSLDASLQVWDVRSSKPVALLKGPGHTSIIQLLAISPDGRTLASHAATEKATKLWDLTTGQVRHTLKERTWDRVVFSDSQTLVGREGAGLKRQLAFIDVLTGEQKHSLALDGAVGTIAAGADGKLLAYAHFNSTLRVVTSAGKEEKQFSPAPGIQAVTFSPDGKIVATGASDGSVQLWDVGEKREISQLANAGKVTQMVMSTNGRTLAMATELTSKVRVYEGGDLRTARTLHSPGTVMSVALSPDGKQTALGWLGRPLRGVSLVDVASGEVLQTFPTLYVGGLTFSADGRLLAFQGGTGVRDQYIEIRELSGNQESEIRVSKYFAHYLHFSPDGKYLAGTRRSDSYHPDFGLPAIALRVWEVSSGKELWHVEAPAKQFAVAWKPDSTALIGALQGGPFLGWDAQTGKELFSNFDSAGHRCLALAPDGKTLLSGDSDGNLHFFEFRAGGPGLKRRHTLRIGPRAGVIRQVAISPEGRHLFTVNGNGTVYILRMGAPS